MKPISILLLFFFIAKIGIIRHTVSKEISPCHLLSVPIICGLRNVSALILYNNGFTNCYKDPNRILQKILPIAFVVSPNKTKMFVFILSSEFMNFKSYGNNLYLKSLVLTA